MCFWNKILQRFQKASALLQSSNTDTNVAVSLLLSLEKFVAELRGQFHGLENDAKKSHGKCLVSIYRKRYGAEDGLIKLIILLNLMQIFKMHKNSVYRVLLSSLTISCKFSSTSYLTTLALSSH